jgi:hypothetical protein
MKKHRNLKKQKQDAMIRVLTKDGIYTFYDGIRANNKKAAQSLMKALNQAGLTSYKMFINSFGYMIKYVREEA